MKLPFGYELSFTKATPPAGLSSISTRGNYYWPLVREPYTGAWQKNAEITAPSVLIHPVVYACVTLIANDVAKCRLRIVEKDSSNIWSEVNVPAFSPVLEKPNHYQNRIQFIENWVVSKLLHGNAYIFKEYDERGTVSAMHVMEPTRSTPLIAPDGSIYYRFGRDNLAGIGMEEDDKGTIYVPSDFVIHDVMTPLYHPLCGVSPITAAGLAAIQGLSILSNAAKFFENSALPSGILTSPHVIDDVTAARIRDAWQNQFVGGAQGKVAVLGDGLTFSQMTMRFIDAQMIEQLKLSSEQICTAFKVPPFKVNVGAAPAYNNVEALDQQYYSQCLQILFECIELCLDHGLGLTAHRTHTYGTEFDLDDLLRMDSKTLIDAQVAAVGGGIRTPNEARFRLNEKPVVGGDTPYLQQQNYSLSALNERDNSEDPFGTSATSNQQQEEENSDEQEDALEERGLSLQAQAALIEIYKGLSR